MTLLALRAYHKGSEVVLKVNHPSAPKDEFSTYGKRFLP